MEDTLFNVFFVVISMLLSKEHNVFHYQDDNIIVAMEDRENFLLEEGAKLEQVEHSVAMELPNSNQEASQNHYKLPRGEGDTDVQKTLPNVKTTVLHEDQMSPVGEQDDFRQNLEKLDIVKDKWTLPASNKGLTYGQANVDQSGSTMDHNFSQEDEEQSRKPQNGQTGAHHQRKVIQASFMEQTSTSNQKFDQDDHYSWYLWKTFSLISLIRVLKKFLKRDSKMQQKKRSTLNEKNIPASLNISTKVSQLDYKSLTSFHEKCVLVPPSKSWQIREFVEGFVNDLLENVKNMSTKGTDMEIEDFVGVGSLYEQWASRKSTVCDIHVPIIPPKPYSFEFELLRESTGSSANCRIKMIKGDVKSSMCPCSSSNLDDMLCLLHPDNKIEDVMDDYMNGPLCQENSPYLAKTHVMKWFRMSIRKAWEEISHKYEFELIFKNSDSPGNLKVRFRSGQVILFNVTPVVMLKDSDAHLVSYLPFNSDMSDTHWPISFAHYENALLQHFTNILPDYACHIRCLQILSYLHKKQICWTGKCGLTSYHLKNALLHLLINKPLSWQPEHIVWRLNDIITFLQQRLQAKTLYHALTGNPHIPSHIGFPVEFREGNPINLFLSLRSNDDLYVKTATHLVEMYRNIPVLIYEYGTAKQ
ncbi:inositol 1,4,5-trisphosphate receptor-interacting protein [Myxocyprinus asiaticus]|uniref:inositol 1,4,5-trisphosphate receptor-interacting protein n=1 Tax=Myxocyprinus asiaticus TaxID=70543 RepID=UPI002221F3F6|nr:inositol 1,4,5-trisphosphate receptor-interacting protein [Myxocyprinus asiaticus]